MCRILSGSGLLRHSVHVRLLLRHGVDRHAVYVCEVERVKSCRIGCDTMAERSGQSMSREQREQEDEVL